MSENTFDAALNRALVKKDILDHSPLRFILKAALSGAYICFALVFAFTVGDEFLQSGSPAAGIIGGLCFSIALILIILGSADLFTGNVMYFTMSTLEKKTTLMDLLKNWVVTYFGNLVGILIFAGIFIGAGIYSNIDPDHYLIEIATKKIELSQTERFFRAILCNWLICLAIWIPMQTKDGTAKVLITILMVTAFFVSGYEHCIANIAIYTVSLTTQAAPDALTLSAITQSLIPVTFGNIIGGALFVGAVYVYLNRDYKTKKKQIIQNQRLAG